MDVTLNVKLYCDPNRSCRRQRKAVLGLETSQKALQWARQTPHPNKRHLQVRCSTAATLPPCGLSKICSTCDSCQLVDEDDFVRARVCFQMPKTSEKKVKQK